MKTITDKIQNSKDKRLRFVTCSTQLIALISLLTISISLNAQQLQSFSDKNYNDRVQTVLLHPTTDSLAKPIIHLNDMMGKLHLQFDVFSNDAPYMYYTFIHCNNDWTQQSDIQSIEYLSGFDSDDIENYSFSLNTMVDYVHFDLVFPTEVFRSCVKMFLMSELL